MTYFVTTTAASNEDEEVEVVAAQVSVVQSGALIFSDHFGNLVLAFNAVSWLSVRLRRE